MNLECHSELHPEQKSAYVVAAGRIKTRKTSGNAVASDEGIELGRKLCSVIKQRKICNMKVVLSGLPELGVVLKEVLIFLSSEH